MNQPTMSFEVNGKTQTYPITQLNWDSQGNIYSFCFEDSSRDKYYFYRQPDSSEFRNVHRNLVATLHFH